MCKSDTDLMSFKIPKTHFKARGIQTDYPGTYASGLAERAHVPDNQVPWIQHMRDYEPTPFTHTAVLAQPIWADPANVKQITDFNKGSRSSHHGLYEIDTETNLPKNPVGRTGITERGLLGKWGPNHAADPLVTRWKNKGRMELEFVAIKRKDTGEWALPGGMVEKGETVSLTLKKEFMEETQNILEKDEIQAEKVEKSLEKLFSNPTKNVYRGYVDDPRNTDNSWMETICTLFHDDDGTFTEGIELEAGDDASQAQWITIELDDPNFKLYASHKRMVEIGYHFVIGKFGGDIAAALFNFTNSYFRRYT